MNETLRTLHSLRTIHGNFSQREITDQDLHTILEAAMRAANASARQSYSIIVLEDRETMKNSGTREAKRWFSAWITPGSKTRPIS